jgi:TPR repeat protein
MSDKYYQIDNNNYPQLLNKQNSGTLNINNNSSHQGLPQIIQKFFKVNILEIEPTIQYVKTNVLDDLSTIIDNLVNLSNKGKEDKKRKKFVLDYFNDHKINLQEVHYWLLINKSCSNSIYLLGYLNYYGIGININEKNAFILYQKAAELGNKLAQFELATMYLSGKGADVDHNKVLELSKKLSEIKYSCGVNLLGYCYECGFGTIINKQKAFKLYQKAADLGNINGMNNLGYCYEKGIGVGINDEKALELYQKAANLGYNLAQQYLAWMYEIGHVTEKNIEQAIYWYEKSAEQGDKFSQNKLNHLLK